MRRQIGTYILTEPKTFRRSYETASWFTDIEVPAGEYPIFAVVRDGEVSRTWGETPFWSLPGIVTASCFINRVFWASSARINEDVGKPDTYGASTYTHALAKAVLDGADWVRLADDIEARPIHFVSIVDGKPCTTYGLFEVEAEPEDEDPTAGFLVESAWDRTH